jgi:TetR/AcrR family transcriptional regulator
MPTQTFFNLPPVKRDLIISVALKEFTETDYESASISKIVAETGIAKGSFYQYFKDKLDLYRFLLDEGTRIKTEFLAQHPPTDNMANPFIYLRWLLKVGLRFELAHPLFANLAQRAISGHSPLPVEWRQSIEKQSLEFFSTLLTQGIANGYIRSDLKVEIAGYILYAVMRDMSTYLLHRLNVSNSHTDHRTLFAEHEAEVETIFNQLFESFELGMAVRR